MKASQNDEVVNSVAEKLLRVLIDRAKRDAWIERLRSVEELDVNHAETELHLLELFAIQTAISTGPTQELRNLAAVIFKLQVCSRTSVRCSAWLGRQCERCDENVIGIFTLVGRPGRKRHFEKAVVAH
jgi:hypothetical protein